MAWYTVSSLWGELIGHLPEPNSYTITEPVKDGTSTGELRIPLPADPEELAELRELLRPDPRRSHSRAVVWEDDDTGKVLFGGPIPYYPHRDGAEVVVPLVDWRAWFYHAQLRAVGTNFSRRDIFISTLQQEEVMRDLVLRAFDTDSVPFMVIDHLPDTGVTHKYTAKMFQENIGKFLDDLASRHKGAEWGTYVTRADDTHWIPHFKVYWPEKRSTKTPLLISYREGDGGNAAGYNWPAGAPAATRIFAVDGAEDSKLWGVATLPGVKSEKELLWEETVTLIDGTKKKADATQQAKGELKKALGREGEFTMTVLASQLAFTDYIVGDRFHVILEDNWDALDVPAARCTQRVLSGGANEPTQQQLTLDIGDAKYASDGELPGYSVFL